MTEFCHLHCHTQYSLLDGASEIGAMMDKAVADGQKGVALTDHGNMFGAFKFVAEAEKRKIKPIIGCEFYLVEDMYKKSFAKAKGEKDKRFHQLLLAKNEQGYKNLTKLCSLGFINGLYGKFPRIDKKLLVQYSEGLIASSCCIGAEVPQAIMHGDEEKAEKLLKWWLDVFGDDYYIEIQRHRGLENIDGLGISQEDINQTLLRFAKKYNVKVIATNDSHYVEEEDYLPHDILLCINTGNLVVEEKRFKFPSSDFYFKTQAQMGQLFKDVPQSLDNTMEIFDKVDTLTLARDVLLPAFPLPKGFKTQEDYLRHLTYVGAKKHYGTITPKIKERIDFELSVINKTGYPGYFLIVQDFTTAAREMDVAVGPGRGSAAGAVVSYCLGITNIDPIKYDLLFERFLNPERVSMPDIDIDFDDVGRQKVIDFVIEKYGQNQVAQIITYGSMAAKSSIRDVGRVMNIPLQEVDKISKAFPTHLSATLKKVLADDGIDKKLKDKMNSEDIEKANVMREMFKQQDDIGKLLRTARQLEGSIRNTGIHACGVVITPDDITNYVPVKTDKNSGMYVTQFDNSVAEDAGLLKMDFLGLKTLTIIKDAVKNIQKTHDIKIIPDDIPLDDPVTYELFQRGETIGVFQYESAGMQKYMRELEPTEFSDLIAMNALYRPGPLEYIPEFINRKHGRSPVIYDLDAMEEYLAETYGITVYQEQVMLLSQKLANFTKGQADMLRKGMGKKKKKLIDMLFPMFLEGGQANGHAKEKLEKIWKDWEAFASYAFNKSHSTCYAYVAFQTAYLKANYPAEFMASVLTHNKNDISKITFFLKECRRMDLTVLGPDVNESEMDFTVNKKGQIRIGMSALKGVGEGPVEAIVSERDKNGPFKDIFEMMRRLDLKNVNKRVMESLALSGGFDLFEDIHRAQYFESSEKYDTFIAHLLKYGAAYQHQLSTAQNSLFGASKDVMIPEPKVPTVERWGNIQKLEKEKEIIGVYISGHPLDEHRLAMKSFTTCSLDRLDNFKGQRIKVAGIITDVQHRISAKNGQGWGKMTLQDFSTSLEMLFFKEDYIKFKNYMNLGEIIHITADYKQNWRKEFELKPQKIQLMDTVRDEKTEGITLNINLQALTPMFINELEMLCNRKQGKHKLKMVFYDQAQQVKLDLVARGKNVNADAEFVDELDRLGVNYKLN